MHVRAVNQSSFLMPKLNSQYNSSVPHCLSMIDSFTCLKEEYLLVTLENVGPSLHSEGVHLSEYSMGMVNC